MYTGDLNFEIIDLQMEITDGGTHKSQAHANALLQYEQEQCMREYIEEPKRRTTYWMYFSL